MAAHTVVVGRTPHNVGQLPLCRIECDQPLSHPGGQVIRAAQLVDVQPAVHSQVVRLRLGGVPVEIAERDEDLQEREGGARESERKRESESKREKARDEAINRRRGGERDGKKRMERGWNDA